MSCYCFIISFRMILSIITLQCATVLIHLFVYIMQLNYYTSTQAVLLQNWLKMLRFNWR